MQIELIKIIHRYGSIILNKTVVNCNLYGNSIKPGAIILTIRGADTMLKSTIIVPAKVRKQKKEKKRETAFALPSFTRVFVKTGINEIFKIPSEKSLRTRSKGLKAIKKASLWEETPKQIAISTSLIRPSSRLINVKKLISAVVFNAFIISFS